MYRAERARLDEFIGATLDLGRDFGVITGEGFGSKPTLFKPGAEKICLFYGWLPQFSVDADTLAALQSGPGTIAYLCTLVGPQGGLVVGEGRGAAKIGEGRIKNANMAVKIAEKRALVDAVLRAAGLSERFTQDLEDEGGAAEPPPDRDAGRVFGGSGTLSRAPAPTREDLRAQDEIEGDQRAKNLGRIRALAYAMLGGTVDTPSKTRYDLMAQAEGTLQKRAQHMFPDRRSLNALDELSEMQSRHLLDVIETAHENWLAQKQGGR